MTLGEALQLVGPDSWVRVKALNEKGAITGEARDKNRIFQIDQLWTNEARSIVRVTLKSPPSRFSGVWLDPTEPGWEKVPGPAKRAKVR